jgi:hypothetical protein
MRAAMMLLLFAATVASWTARVRWRTPSERCAFPVMCSGDSIGDGDSVGDADGDGVGDSGSDGGEGGDDDRSLQASLRRAAAAKLGASVDSMMPADDLAWSSAGSSKMATALQEGRCACVSEACARQTLSTCTLITLTLTLTLTLTPTPTLTLTLTLTRKRLAERKAQLGEEAALAELQASICRALLTAYNGSTCYGSTYYSSAAYYLL